MDYHCLYLVYMFISVIPWEKWIILLYIVTNAAYILTSHLCKYLCVCVCMCVKLPGVYTSSCKVAQHVVCYIL